MPKTLTVLLLGLIALALPAQQFTISGYVTDGATGEALIGANVYDFRTLKGTTTNTYGFFSLTLPSDTVVFTVSYVGYHTVNLPFVLDRDTAMAVGLRSMLTLKEVEVKADKVMRIEEQTQMSTINIPIQQIQKLPAFMGEVDVLKILQLLPGVQSGSEGSSGLYVRGGSPDQNLILLDGVPVYNVTHLFGFFSVFNSDAINNVQLIKGGFPARYGGRLSSVLEINMKEGNMKEFKGSGSLGVIASRITLEGPIIKDKASFIISARRTYIDILAKPIIKASFPGDGDAGYYFYDLNGKVNYRLGKKDRLYLSAYAGDDRFFFREKQEFGQSGTTYGSEYSGGLDWGNLTAVLRWNHQFNQKLFSNLTLNYTKYTFNTRIAFREYTKAQGSTIEDFTFALRYFSGIRDWSTRVDFDWLPNPDHYVKFGANAIWHSFRPGAVQFKLEEGTSGIGIDTTITNSFVEAGEYRIFVEDDIRISQRLKVNAGMHASLFAVQGETYTSLEPRVSGRYMLAEDLSAKASYARMSQYIHLLTNTGVGLPTDLWVPATANVLPQRSWQVAAGLARTLPKGYEVSVEGYYKVMDNIIEYKEGSSYLGSSDNWEAQVESGTGWSYGAEVFLQKKEGPTTGWVGYTLSWTERQFENINFGKRFPFRYDRRHDLSVAVVHELSERIELSATFVYGTGNAITLPIAVYEGEVDYFGYTYREPVYYYNERNGFRMRAYHRLDLGLALKKETKWGERSWNFNVYNTYNRRNPFFIYYGYGTGWNQSRREFRQVSLFPIMPSVSFNFKF
jgi:hypothetical protein